MPARNNQTDMKKLNCEEILFSKWKIQKIKILTGTCVTLVSDSCDLRLLNINIATAPTK